MSLLRDSITCITLGKYTIYSILSSNTCIGQAGNTFTEADAPPGLGRAGQLGSDALQAGIIQVCNLGEGEGE